jgi:hypothetical protein
VADYQSAIQQTASLRYKSAQTSTILPTVKCLWLPLLLLGFAAQVLAAPGPPSQSKISVHLLVNYSPGASQIIQARPRVIKILGTDSGMIQAARDFKASTPDGKVVCRIYTSRTWARTEDPAAAGSNFWQTVLAPALVNLSAQDRALIDYVEGPNEGDSTPTWGSSADADWYNTFWLHLAPHIANAGFRPLGFSIAVGNPPGSATEIQDKLNRIAPALRLCQQLGGGWSYHSYSLPYSTNLTDEIWYSVRYRQYYSYFASAHPDLVNLPLVLTEAGIDGLGPWSTRGDTNRYQNWLTWFDSEIRKDNYCLGVTLFQIGETGGWNGFNVEPIAPWLASYLAANPGTSAPPALQLCVRERSNTLTLQFSGPPHLAPATNPTNYLIRLSGTNALAVLSAVVTNATNVLLTTGLAQPGANYIVSASNLVHASSTPGARFLNGQALVRVPYLLASITTNSLWRYDQRGVDLGAAWRARVFNDSTWPQGSPLFAYETGSLPEPIRTPLTTNTTKLTFYFRKPFTLPGNITTALLRLRPVLDDAAVFHINGAELFRLGMPLGPATFSTPAARTVDNAIYEGPFVLTPTNLVTGTNVLAVEVHQINTNSSDVVFGAIVEALVLPSQSLPPRLLANRTTPYVRLEWDATAVLEASRAPNGPWAPAPTQTSPAFLPTTNATEFFRLYRPAQ